MGRESDSSIAFCWYEPEDWLKVKKSAADADKQDASYEEWKSNANRAISAIRAQGHGVAKITIKAEEFLAWCHENEILNDGDARSRFAAIKLQERKNTPQQFKGMVTSGSAGSKRSRASIPRPKRKRS